MSASVRFIHAADLHLDAPFKGVDATDPRVREALVASTYRALDALVAACLEHGVDFLVLAGDVYNQAERSLRAEFAFRDACARLADAGIRVFVARGNHDPASGWSARLALPDSVHVFNESAVERVVYGRDGEVVCALYGRSYRAAAERENLALGFRRESDDPLAIGVLHANVGSHAEHEAYAPCTLEDLRAARMDYWALGHIHKPEVLSENPCVAYPGCTQGLNPTESGARGCLLVTLTDSGAVLEPLPTASLVWENVQVHVEQTQSIEEVREAMLRAIDEAAGGADDRPAVLRLELIGRSPAHVPLARPGVLHDLVEDVRADALARDPWVWIDRVVDATRRAIDMDALREGEDFAGDLVRLADGLLRDEQAMVDVISAASAPVLAALDSRDAPAIDAAYAADVLERARTLALDRLLAEDDR